MQSENSRAGDASNLGIRSAIIIVRILVGLPPLLWLAGLAQIFRGWNSMAGEGGVRFAFLIGFRIAVLAWAFAYTVRAVLLLVKKESLPNQERIGWTTVRWWFYCIFAAAVLASLSRAVLGFNSPDDSSWSVFISACILFLAFWTRKTLDHSGNYSPKNSFAVIRLDLIAANILLTLFLLEVMVSGVAAVSTSPLFWETVPGKYNVDRQKPPKGSLHFNKAFNSQGYYDDEFFTAGEHDFSAAVLTDSFGVGMVPYDYNFISVAERKLQSGLINKAARVALNNYGVCSIGLPEYYHILTTEALATNPDLVVLCVFVGNDLLMTGNRLVWRKYVFQNWWLWRLTRRLMLLTLELDAGPEAHIFNFSSEPATGEPEYSMDPAKEAPTFSEENYLNLECDRISFTKYKSESMSRVYETFFSGLKLFSASLGEKLLVVVIPDEYQVNDELYQKCLARLGSPDNYSRYYPQERINAFCRENNIRHLDLLPVLLEAEKGGRTYHIRDTHWNVRGNRVAGEAIADYILAYREDRPAKTAP